MSRCDVCMRDVDDGVSCGDCAYNGELEIKQLCVERDRAIAERDAAIVAVKALVECANILADDREHDRVTERQSVRHMPTCPLCDAAEALAATAAFADKDGGT